MVVEFNQGGDRSAGEHAFESIGSHPGEHRRQARAGDGLQAIGQQLQTEEKEREAGGELPEHLDEV